MADESFDDLFDEARAGDDYWTEHAVLDVTESIHARMEELGLQRSDLARRLGTSPSYVTKILRGDANFTLATLVKLSRALDCEMTILFEPRLDGSEDSKVSEAA